MADLYYHAGVAHDGRVVRWSEHTRRSRLAACREAIQAANRIGGDPVVEYWDREWGLRPGTPDAVIGTLEPDEVRAIEAECVADPPAEELA